MYEMVDVGRKYPSSMQEFSSNFMILSWCCVLWLVTVRPELGNSPYMNQSNMTPMVLVKVQEPNMQIKPYHCHPSAAEVSLELTIFVSEADL